MSVFNAIDKTRSDSINLDQWMKVIPDAIVSKCLFGKHLIV